MFWDSSAVVPVLVAQDRSAAMAALLRSDKVLAAHPLRTADALQLAAALVWSGEAAAGEAFVCLDERLRDAARQEGFDVLPDRPKRTPQGAGG